MDPYVNYRRYRKARTIFAIKTYLLLFLWLILALAQWCLINFLVNAGITFHKHYYIGYITFFLSVLLFAFFIFFAKLRRINVLNFIISLIIVELQIISVFPVMLQCSWIELLSFYALCFVIIWLFILIGTFLPKKIDFTVDVAILFIVSFLFLLIAVFFLIIRFAVFRQQEYTYIIAEIAINIIIILFVMYHAQTINGSRFAEMRLNDALLGSLILFHDFLIIFWLTFYWQILVQPFTPETEVVYTSTQIHSSTTESTNFPYGEEGEYDGKSSYNKTGRDSDKSERDPAVGKEVEFNDSLGDTVKGRGRNPPKGGVFASGEVKNTPQ